MAPLLDIPPELFYQIFGLLYSSDLLSLRQTSKAVNELITPIATAGRKLIIDLGTKSSFESDFKTIREVSTTGTISTLLPHIRSLLIESLHAPRSRVRRLDKPGPDEPATRALLDQHFAPFIRNLQALDTVQWKIRLGKDPENYFAPVANAIASLPRLRTLVVNFYADEGMTIPDHQRLPPLRVFKNLNALSVFSSVDLPEEYCISDLVPAIASSPSLTSFKLSTCYGNIPYTGSVHCASLQKILASRPPLVSLKLRNVPIHTEGLAPILSSLKTLKVTAMSRAHAVDWGALWTTLRENRIHLEVISVIGTEKATNEFFEYLQSYTGLQKLSIKFFRMEDQRVEDDAGARFWQKVLPHHVDTIVKLKVKPYYEGSWCYGPMVSAVLVQCLALKELQICSAKVDPAWATEKGRLFFATGVTTIQNLGDDFWGSQSCCEFLILHDISCLPVIFDNLIVSHKARTKASRGLSGRSRRVPCKYNTILEGLFLSLRATETAAQNWPKMAQNGFHRLLGRRDKADTGELRRQYRKERPDYDGESEDESTCESENEEEEVTTPSVTSAH